ncbi:Uu.00g058690.m01.CDS01 [Anthostomella pinea]|uniref:Uu.00g058690.m01.CDS01 n=1 Tax=Anthostomella pinea TaxID=933095 RepID=A0AAI8VSK0_9PEZI|nr:Uu.00g058690.m01.CDS01 [Anthostomella pinea]
MSADLFAEFVDFSQSQPQQSHSKPSTQPPPPKADPFSLDANPSYTSSIPWQQNQQWGSSLAQPSPAGQWPGSQPGAQGWAGSSTVAAPQPVAREENDDDDGWGDFEVAPVATQSPASLPPTTAASNRIPSKPSTLAQQPTLQRTRIVRAPTLDLMTNNLVDIPGTSTVPDEVRRPSWAQASLQDFQKPSPSASSQKSRNKPIKADPNVLFDAGDFEGEQDGGTGDGDDDFGDFESVASPAQPQPDLISKSYSTTFAPTNARASQLLSGLSSNEPHSQYPQPPRSPSFQDRNPFPGLAIATPPETQKQLTDKPKSTPVTAWPGAEIASPGSNGLEDDWGAFGDLPDEPGSSNSKEVGSSWDWDSVDVEPVKPTKETKLPKPTQPTSASAQKPITSTSTATETDSTWDWDSVDVKGEAPTDIEEDGLPPVNIPPPSILLSAFPQLFDQANNSLYKPISGQSFSIKNRILSDPKTFEFLKGYLNLATVAARIIAGRKQRWHRDKILAQSMSISAAGSKGMKLAGVDKAQTVREDREAADVVGHWKEQVGRLRSAVAAANSSTKNTSEQLKIPEITEAMPIQTQKGGPTAPKACVICGLKRNERIPKVDYEVEDSFGEWWIDHWGHLTCKRFWLQHESTLRQR